MTVVTESALSMDVDIHRFLEAEGFVGDPMQRARMILEAAGLTRPGKRRFAASKLDSAREVLRSQLIRVCHRKACRDGCFADAVSVATGCWPGKRTLRLIDHGKVAATFVDIATGRAIRMWPDPNARSLGRGYAPDASSPWHAQLVGYQTLPTAALLCKAPVATATTRASRCTPPSRCR